MFDFLLVVLTLTSPFLLIALSTRYYRYKSTKMAFIQQNEQIVNQKYIEYITNELADLKERTAVLEKIVTEKEVSVHSMS